MELLRRAFGALSAAVGVVVLMGFVVYDSIGRGDGGATFEPVNGRLGEPAP